MNPDTHELRWSPVKAVNVFPFEGELDGFKRGNDQFEFTEQHRWPIVAQPTHPDRGYRHELRRWGQMPKQCMIPTTGEFVGEESCLSPRLAAILGWVVSDGHQTVRRDDEMWVSQKPGPVLDEIVDLLGMKPRKTLLPNGVAIVTVRARDARAINEVYQRKPSLPSVAARLSREAAEAMLDAIVKADGWWIGGNGGKRGKRRAVIGQSASNWPVREAVQILAILTGRNANIGVRVGNEYPSVICLSTRKGLWHPRRKRTTSRYRGNVWCPTTTEGTWYVEHDGSCLPTGNTDDLLSYGARECGYELRVIRAYQFEHRQDKKNRSGIVGRAMQDCEQYVRRLAEWNWQRAS